MFESIQDGLAAAFKTLGKSVLKGAEDSNTAFSK